MELEKVELPNVLKNPNCSKNLIAFEGVDACGKSTICNKLDDNYCNFKLVKIPQDYVAIPFKEYLAFKASNMANALIYTASLIDRKKICDNLGSEVEFVIMDRSIWSTIAMSYVKYPDKFEDIIKLFEIMYKYIPIPQKVYIIDISYEICRKRVSMRNSEEQRFDEMPIEEYYKHMEFYYWLERQNIGAKIIKAESLPDIESSVRFYHDDIIGEKK